MKVTYAPPFGGTVTILMEDMKRAMYFSTEVLENIFF